MTRTRLPWGSRCQLLLPPFSLCPWVSHRCLFVSCPISHFCWEMRIFTHCSPSLSRTARQDLSWAAPWGTVQDLQMKGTLPEHQELQQCRDQRCSQSLMVESAAFPTEESHWNAVIQRFLSQHYSPNSQNIIRLTELMSRCSCFLSVLEAKSLQ